MDKQLYPHNQQAYEKVMETFKTADRTCVVHPTGTGKSYIVAAVCQHFDKIIIIAPNTFVLTQQKEAIEDKNNVFYTTYAWLLLNVYNIKDKYDLIVLDEFHRAGAKEWGAAVHLLLENQPQAKVLGTSATPVRYLDGEKDIAKEIFNNNVASEISIAKAWSQNILPIPTYVTGFFNFDKIVNNAIERIEQNNNLKEQEKRNRIFKLSNLKLDWEKSSGMVEILKNHLKNKTGRILIFCAHIDSTRNIQKLAKQWFSKAGFNVSGIYVIHSEQSESQQKRQLQCFSKDKSEGIRLLLSINMLNEGIHIPDINAVIMLRTTSSPIIYLQQLGRCLTAATSEKPLILDVVDNITTTSSINGIADEFTKLEAEEAKRNNTLARRHFRIIDYTLHIRQIIEKLSVFRKVLDLTIEEKIKIVEDFVQEHKRLPSCYNEEERKELNCWRWLRRHHKDIPEVDEIYNKYSSCTSLNRKINDIKEYISENNHLPTKKSASNTLYNKWCYLMRYYSNHPFVQEMLNKYKEPIETRYLRDVKAFVKEHNRLPRRMDGEIYTRWKSLLRRYPSKQVTKIQEKYKSYKSIYKRIQDLKTFVVKKGCFPTMTIAKEYYGSWRWLKTRYPEHPDVKSLIKLEQKLKERRHDKR